MEVYIMTIIEKIMHSANCLIFVHEYNALD